jgi:hypothetical protein
MCLALINGTANIAPITPTPYGLGKDSSAKVMESTSHPTTHPPTLYIKPIFINLNVKIFTELSLWACI